MKISYNWLKQYLISDLDPHQLCQILTDIGLNVENYEKFQISNTLLKEVVVGKITSFIPHPNANHLKVTRVDVGKNQDVQIICLAPELAVNQKVLVALIGACVLDRNGNQTYIKGTIIKGIESQGIICSARELAIQNNSESILLINSEIPIGTLASKLFKADEDYLIEIGLTPNRADAMSNWGVARDLHLALKARGYKAELLKPEVKDFSFKEDALDFSIYIKSSDRCIRYSGCLIKEVKITHSPFWLKKRLEGLGLQPINNLVDITNFVMYELGQPLHIYDADFIQGKTIYIKTPQENQHFKTLDSVERILDKEDLTIFDAQKPLCLAGILGGLNSGVTQKTQNIFLESACFNRVSIRRSAKRHGLKTESSFRFERGTDPEQTVYALKRAALLIRETTSSKIHYFIDLYPNPVQNARIKLRYEKIYHLIGEIIPKKQIKKILLLLGISIIKEEKEKLIVSVPSYRVDITREVDLIEEILRIYGYNLIKTPEHFRFSLISQDVSLSEELEDNSSKILSAQGFYEVINLSLTHYKYQKFINNSLNQAIEIINPISEELAVLRQSLLFGLMERIYYNISRKNTSLKLFEWGKTYTKKDKKYIEIPYLSIIITNKGQREHWLSSKDSFLFFELKGVVEALLKKNRVQMLDEQLIKHPLLQQGLLITCQEKTIAIMGEVKKEISEHFNIDQQIFYAEIPWESVVKIFQENKTHIYNPSKYPQARRDLAILIDESVTFEKLCKNIQKTEKTLLKDIKLFDVYTGNQLPIGKKSYALSFYFEDTKQTLTNDRIETVMGNIRYILRKTLDAEFR